MIPMTYEPLEGILVVVARPYLVDRYTWGMISSDLHGAEIPQMDVVTPAKGKKTSEICTGRKKDVALGDTLADLDPGGSCSST